MIFLLLPLDMDADQQKLAAALLFVIVLWISEAIPIPIGGLLGIALIVLIGVAPADDVFSPFGSTTSSSSSARSSSPRRCSATGSPAGSRSASSRSPASTRARPA